MQVGVCKWPSKSGSMKSDDHAMDWVSPRFQKESMRRNTGLGRKGELSSLYKNLSKQM